nr:MAG TPA: hypothetical protein [Caudoviricetes sp.]
MSYTVSVSVLYVNQKIKTYHIKRSRLGDRYFFL